jgi:cold shock CspA family protein
MTTNQGILKAWNFERGYGFIYERIQLKDGKTSFKAYFIHVNDIASGEPIVDCVARFNVAPGKAGKSERAIDVEFELVGGAA